MFSKGKNTNSKEEVLIAVSAQSFGAQTSLTYAAVKSPSLAGEETRQTASVMSDGLEITGKIKSQGSIEINGILQGDINTNFLTIGRTATVIGNVTADDILIHGTVLGQVFGFKVRLSSTAKVEGDIYYKDVSIDSGANLNGNLTRQGGASTLDLS